MNPPHLDFRVLKQRVSIEQVLQHGGLLDRFKRRGDTLTGPCPIHKGDNRGAFVVSRSKNLWHCFSGCGCGGDVVDLVRRLNGLSYRETAVYLASIADEVPTRPDTSAATSRRPSFKPFLRPLPLEFDTPLLRSKGIHKDTAQHFEAGRFRGRGMLEGCVAVRLHDPRGEVLGYAGRRLDDRQVILRGKWVFPPGLPKKTLLYGFHRAAEHLHKGLVIVEGPWEVMRLAQLGIPAVALLGTALSNQQRRLVMQAPRVVVLMDGDLTGRSAARTIAERLKGRKTYTKLDIAVLPDGCDPDDLPDYALLSMLAPFLF